MKERKLPEGWQFRCLDNCYNIKKGKKVELIEEYSKELIRYIQIDDLRNNDNIKYCNNDKTYIKANKEDIIIAWDGANAGTIGYALEGAIGSTLAILRSKVKYINTKFIGIYLKSKFRYLRDNCTGATIPHIQRKILENILLPIPPPGTQEKIVQVLEKAEKALEKKKEAIRLLDDLVKSRFIEMFGNPFSNSKGWNKDTIGSVVKSITAGWSANGEAREKREGEKAVLKVSAVTQGYFKEDEYKVIGDDVEIKKYVFPQKGDLLFSRANTREMVGATCIMHKDYPDLLLPDKLWKVLFVDRVNVFYMKYILSEPAIRAEFSAKSTGTSGSMYNVSMDKFKNIEIPVPPIELQNEFANFVNQVDKLKFEMQKSLKELEDNFNSLMQKAFNGELFN